MADTPTLSVLHIASFTGNIGDNANHIGTRSEFAKNIPYQMQFTEMEMREFFWGQRQWDQTLIDTINTYDLCIFGGGNYFELWVERSRTGCSIDLPPELLEKISTPLLFYGLGVDAGQGVPEICRERFERFLSYLLDSPRCCVAVRNDGARKTLKDYFPTLPLSRVIDVPDGGFFFQSRAEEHIELQKAGKNIVINLAGDMLEMRYPGGDLLSPDGFASEFARFVEGLLEEVPDARIIFVPHIFRDLDSIYQVLNGMADPIRRQRVVVAPYIMGNEGCHKLFGLYAKADSILGMRFHANVVAMAVGTPVVGLQCYSQIGLLYEELGLKGEAVSVQHEGFSTHLAHRVMCLLENGVPQEIQASQHKLHKGIRKAHTQIADWLLTLNL